MVPVGVVRVPMSNWQRAAGVGKTLPVCVACEACGKTGRALGGRGFMWHHWSYAPAHRRSLIGLCSPCHRNIHYGNIPEPHTGRVYAGRTDRPRWPYSGGPTDPAEWTLADEAAYVRGERGPWRQSEGAP